MIKILLADDEIEARDNIIQYIDWAANGLELVGAAGDGEEALQMILGCRPDIAILDIYMPKLSGIQVIERCREELPNPPAFIIVSGYNEFSYAQQAIRLKVEEYLLKPFPPRELMEAIQRALLHVEVSRGIANNDFISFVKDCQAEAPRASAGRYPVEGERWVLAAVSAGSAEDVKRSVDGFLAECLPGLPLSAALNYGEMLYFEICRLVMERSGSFPAGNVFFDRSWTRENACAQLSEALHSAALDAHCLIAEGRKRSSVVMAAVEYIDRHYAESLTLGRIAEAIFVSPPYLGSLFREKMGVTLTAYIHKVRIDHAKELLLQDQLSIQRIAELVGYRHEKHFMQTFKKAVGMTPSQFRFKKNS